nr:hypothetical protein [uncultured Desulfobulbus sp.]
MNRKYNLFPSGFVQYTFSMFLDYPDPIIFQLGDPRVKSIELNKSEKEDCYDPKWNLVINFNEVESIEEVDSTGSEIIDPLISLLSFTLKIKINNIQKTGHGLTPKPGEGAQCHMIGPSPSLNATGKVGGRKLNSYEIRNIKSDLLNNYSFNKNTLIELFSYSLKNEDPVVRFMLLYLILYEIFGKQIKIDNFIMSIDPETEQSKSPHNNKLETIYSKLRNEITHRVSTSPEEIRNKIIQYLPKFNEITHNAIVQFET